MSAPVQKDPAQLDQPPPGFASWRAVYVLMALSQVLLVALLWWWSAHWSGP